MACGNNHVGRDYLSSQPATSTAKTLGSSEIRAAVERLKLPMVIVDGEEKEGRPSGLGKDGTIDYYIGPDGRQTHEPGLHAHVFHKPNGDVTIEITDRNNEARSSRLVFKNLDGNQVREAEQALAAIMRTLK